MARVARSQGHWILAGLSLASMLALVVLRVLTTPDPRGHGTHEQLGLLPCWMIHATGIPCPGCGVTTAISLLVHGDWRAALATQPFGVLVVLLCALLFARVVSWTLRGQDAWVELQRAFRPWILWSLGAAMLAAWAYKIASLRA